MQAKILDVFLYYNELDLLKARLAYLGPLVDHFVIAEANIDFSGRKKGFALSQKLINTLPFGEKVIYHRTNINLNSLTWIFKRIKYWNKKNRLLWKIQDAQRNSTLNPLEKFSPNDVVIFSDLDEFPSEAAIAKGIHLLHNSHTLPSQYNAYSLDQTFYYYNLSNAAPHEKFYGSVMSTLKDLRKYLPHKFRSQKNELLHLENGGWHFSYFMNEEKILNKIHAISDVENLSAYKKITVQEIQIKIHAGADLYDRGIKLESQEYKKIPVPLLKIIQKFLPHCTQDIESI
jgi:beta-1,4-mannosyl-glycoprotein beta-1,4-N-acetylglucosaminyltransferase